MTHLELFAKFSFLNCMAPGVGLRPRTDDAEQCSSAKSLLPPRESEIFLAYPGTRKGYSSAFYILSAFTQ